MNEVLRYLRRVVAAETRSASDAALLARFVASRDEEAFSALVLRHAGMVYRVCRGVLRHEQDAEDACQATFLVLAQRATRILRSESLACWLHGVALRTCHKARAAAARRWRDAGRPPAGGRAGPAPDLTLREAGQALHEELARLPERYRAPLVLCYLEGSTHDEAAAALGWALTAFRGRLDRARRSLRRRLERRGVSLGAALAAGTLAAGGSRVFAATLAVATSRAGALGVEKALASGAVSPAVYRLMREVLATMTLSPLKLAAAALVGVALAACGYLGYRSWLRSPDVETPAPAAKAAPDTKPGSKVAGDKLTAGEIERRASAVYDRAGRALVRVEREDGTTLGGYAGVIVTADGHVLYDAVVGGGKVTFRLPDGRRATGRLLGWSSEWRVGLAKLDGPGPWPHVELADSSGVKAGQHVVTLGYANEEKPTLFPRPLLNVEGVAGSAVGRWFVLRDEKTTRWRNAPAVFDLDGRLVGVGWLRYADTRLGTIYTDAKVVRSLWDDLTAGKNLDEVRLRGDGGKALAAKKVIPREVEERAKAASVRIRLHPKGRGSSSGTIVSADGMVVTCAHGFGFVLPGTKVIVCLPDGRDAAGKIVGLNHLCDTCLVRITDEGPWPHVETGDSTRMRPGDPCLSIGYGPGKDFDRQPHVRKASIAQQWAKRWGPVLDIHKATWYGGDSGGGIFDADGRLVAYFFGGTGPSSGAKPEGGMRIEVFRKHRDELNGPYEQAGASPLAVVEADLRRAGADARRCVVEVLDGKTPVALGTAVGRNGRILTQANVLPEAPACRLPDGRVLAATVVKIDREHNLAVLKVAAADLPVADWSKADNPPVGAPVSVAALAGPPTAGFVSHPALSIPTEQGGLSVNVRDGAAGPEVEEVFKMAGAGLLRKGDFILSVDGHPTPNREAYLNLWRKEKTALTAGHPARVVVLRGGRRSNSAPCSSRRPGPGPKGRAPAAQVSPAPTAWPWTQSPPCAADRSSTEKGGC